MFKILPDDFAGDGYGFTTNQFGHALGVGFLCFVYGVTFAWFLVFGEFPYKVYIALFGGIAYLAFEVYTQGWQKWDTIEDWWFVNVYGIWGPLCAFSEVEIGSPIVTTDLYAPLPFIGLLAAHLMAGSYVRWRRRQ